MSIRVLHVLDHSIPLHSGYTFRTLSILREQAKLGWHTFHITSPKHGLGLAEKDRSQVLEEDVDGWHFFRIPIKNIQSNLPVVGELKLMRELERRLQEVVEIVRPSILHVHSPVLNALPALRVGRRLGIPVVYEVRAFWEDAAVDHGSTREGSIRYRLTRALETFALKRAQHVFTICEGLRRDIVARGLPEDRVTVIPNAVDIENFEPGGRPDEAIKSRLGLQGKTVLGFIGSYYAYEGLDLLLRALPAILAHQPNVRLLLVGGGPQEKNLKEQVISLGIESKVCFVGRVPHAEVQSYYDLVDILVYPRHAMRLTELVTPLKPLEAMAQGALLIASDVGGHKELIRDGETGLLFNAGQADSLAERVLHLLSNPEKWPLLRIAGRKFVEQERNWARSVSGYQSVYLRLAGHDGK